MAKPGFLAYTRRMDLRPALLAALVLAVPLAASAKGKKKAEDEYKASRYKSKSMESGTTYRFKADKGSPYRIDSEEDDSAVKLHKRKRKKGADEDIEESKYRMKMEQGPRHYRFSEEGTPLDDNTTKVAKAKKEKPAEEAPAAHAGGAAPEGGGPPPAALAGGGGKKAQLKPMGGGGLKGIGGGGAGGGVGGGMKGFGNAGGGAAKGGFKKINPIGGDAPKAPPPGAAPPGGAGDAVAQGQVAK